MKCVKIHNGHKMLMFEKKIWTNISYTYISIHVQFIWQTSECQLNILGTICVLNDCYCYCFCHLGFESVSQTPPVMRNDLMQRVDGDSLQPCSDETTLPLMDQAVPTNSCDPWNKRCNQWFLWSHIWKKHLKQSVIYLYKVGTLF